MNVRRPTRPETALGGSAMKTFLSTATLMTTAGGLALMAAASGAHADGLQPAFSAVRESKPIIDLRMRTETVDQQGMAEDAEAMTMRGRLGFETGKAWNTTLLAEGDLLWPWETHYNSTV